jgi:hypothetical protein
MNQYSGLNVGLGALPLLTDARTRSISAENPTGEKGKGGMAVPNLDDPDPSFHSVAARDLGQGWKVRPCVWIRAGQTLTLMDVDGPGVIQHIWMVSTVQRIWAARSIIQELTARPSGACTGGTF